MANNRNNQESNIPWWAIVSCFIISPLFPLGMILLFMNLSGVRLSFFDRSVGTNRRYYGAGAYQQGQRKTPPTGATGQQTYSRPGSAAGPGMGTQGAAGQSAYGRPGTSPGMGSQQRAAYVPPKQAAAKAKTTSSSAKFLKKIKGGKLMTFLGGLAGFGCSIGMAAIIDAEGFALTPLFPLFGCTCAGLFTMFTGIGRTRRARRCRLYMGVIGLRKSVFLSDLASAAGVNEKKVIADLQWMLAEGILPMGYIDRASNRLVLTDQGYEAAAQPTVKAEPKQEPATEAKNQEADDDAILREIKRVNDAIPDEVMSRKIDRIGEITGKILDYQRRNPAKAPELRQFLNYYLPTTLKILNAYAQMDAQGVEGENISAAKERIEGMMDKVVEGFEKQLDQLFKTEAMDIATDVEVLERMLDKDGLGSGMTLGG